MGKSKVLIPAFLAALLLLSACAGTARLNSAPEDLQKDVLKDVQERWEAYHVYATVWRAGQVRAMLFNPRDENRKILAERWGRIESKEEISRLLTQIRTVSPRLFQILGPGERLFGYLYAPDGNIQMQVIDEQTIRVYEIKPPAAPSA